MKLLPQQLHLQWSSSHNNHISNEAPPTTITPSVKLLPQQSLLRWSSSHNYHTFGEAPPTTITPSVKLLPQQSHLQWSSSHNNQTFREAPPTIITASVKLLPQQSHLQGSSSHNNHTFSEAPPTTITSSVKLLPLQFSNKCWNIPISLQVKSTSIRASVWSEICRDSLLKDRENMRDTEPCRMKHTEEQTGWCLFLNLHQWVWGKIRL